jgi:hypothetical protein
MPACRLPGSQPTAYGTGEIEMALRHAGKGYVLGVHANSQFNSWGAKPRLPGLRPRSRTRLIPPPGIVYRPEPAPRARGCSTGLISNWPTLRRPHITRPCPVFGPEAFWSAVISPMASWPSSSPGVRPGPQGKPWWRLRAGAGPSRTASRRPKTSLVSTTTRPALGAAGIGTAGIGTSRSSCWPSPCWPPSAAKPTPPHPQKAACG